MPKIAPKSASKSAKTGASRAPRIVLKLNGPKSSLRTIRFGSFMAELPKPPKDELKRNVAAGAAALKGLKTVLMKPGVRLPVPKNTPLYIADPDDTTALIELRGARRTRGRFKNGKFVAAAK